MSWRAVSKASSHKLSASFTCSSTLFNRLSREVGAMALSKLHLRARLRSVITCLAVITCSASVAVASTWINGAGGVFTTAGNWSGGVPNGPGAIADFTTLDVSGDISVQLDSDVTLGQLAFGDTGLGSAASWELWTNVTPFPVITLDNGASKPVIRVNTMTPTE